MEASLQVKQIYTLGFLTLGLPKSTAPRIGLEWGGGLKFEYYFTGGMRQVKNVNEL